MNRFYVKYDDLVNPKKDLLRIFERTSYKTMENQYCKVGTVTPITTGNHAISILEYQYQSFMEKASNLEVTDSRLVEFFELKAEKIKRILENLVQ